jgi:hypothetical protein
MKPIREDVFEDEAGIGMLLYGTKKEKEIKKFVDLTSVCDNKGLCLFWVENSPPMRAAF